VLDAEAAEVMALMRSAGVGGFAGLGLERARAVLDGNGRLRGPEVASVVDRPLGPTGTPVRIYRPEGHGAGAVVYLHGGGWVLGSLDSHDALCRHLAAESRSTVVSVDYRLAPEHPFPAAVDDAWAVIRHLLDHGDELDIDPSLVAVAGDSAGGNLAAVSAQLARDAGRNLAVQILIYPVVDRRLDRPSMQENAVGYILERDDMTWFWDLYAPGAAPGEDPRAEPSVGRLDGLAPAVVITAEHDPLRDEGEDYAAQLERAGVPVSLHRFDGMFHGFVAGPGFLRSGDRALAIVVDALRGAFDPDRHGAVR